MEAGQRTARDRDEQEREQRAGEHWALAAAGELGDSGRLHDWAGDQDADREQGDGADLHERRQVVARREQKPHRQHRCGEAVDDQAPAQRYRGKAEPCLTPCRFGNPAARDDGQQQQGNADQRHLGHPTRTQEAQIDAHEDRDGYCHRDREDAPRALGKGLHHHQCQHRQEDRHDRDDPDDGGRAADGTEFVADHLTQRAAPSSGGDPQHEVVLHTSGENRADDDPDGARQITHLHRQHRADERTRPRDRGEVMAEQHAPVGRHVVGVVLEDLGGRCVVVARTDDLHLDQPRVEPEADHVGADRRDDEPHRVDRLPAEERDDRPGDRTEQRDDPEDDLVSGA